VFDVNPAPPPKFWYILIFGGIVGLIGLASITSGFGIVLLAMAAFCFWYGWSRDLRPKPHRAKSSFRVTASEIQANGQTFKKADIHRLLLRNSITDQELNVTTYTDNPNAAAGMAFRAQSALGANALTVEMGGRSTLLAGGMDETTAYGLLHDVSKILDYKIG
jgi:hypothetical protein